MIVGFNTDIKYRSEVFHIQTEDKGDANPTIETLVYLHGEILISRRISRAHLSSVPEKAKKIKSLMKVQHDQVINELKNGQFLHLLSLDTQNLDERKLDDMVLEYLASPHPTSDG